MGIFTWLRDTFRDRSHVASDNATRIHDVLARMGNAKPGEVVDVSEDELKYAAKGLMMKSGPTIVETLRAEIAELRRRVEEIEADRARPIDPSEFKRLHELSGGDAFNEKLKRALGE